jgi:hypothetical protein
LGPPVQRIRAADHEALLFKFGDMPAEDGGTDAESLRELRGAGFALPHKPKDSLQRHTGLLAANIDGGNTADGALEIEDPVHEIGCSA